MKFLFCVAMLAVASALTPVTLLTPASERIEGEYMVQFNDPQSFENFKAKQTRFAGVQSIHEFGDYMGFHAKLNEEELWEVQNMEGVSAIEPNLIVRAFQSSGNQSNPTWGIDRSDQRSLPLDRLYRWTGNGAGVVVAVLDTGILTSHSNFGGRAVFGADCTGSSCQTNSNTGDPQGHGTHCAGTVGSSTYGIAKGATLMNVRVLGATGGGSIAGIVNGIQFVVSRVSGRRIISMSLGGGASTALDNAVNSAFSSGVLSVVAAGNSNNNACTGSPARAAQAVTVAASDSSDRKASFSSYGNCCDLYAPGVSVTSTSRTGGTATMSGTSMACPHVAGAAAIFAGRGQSASQIRSSLVNGASTNVISGNPSGTPNRLLYTL